MDDIERIERRLKLHDVRVLIAVAEARSMHKASERLGTSQPAISRTIAELEHSVGARLLDRNSRGIEPTPYGRVLIKRGIAAFDEFRQGMKTSGFSPIRRAGSSGSRARMPWRRGRSWLSSSSLPGNIRASSSMWRRDPRRPFSAS